MDRLTTRKLFAIIAFAAVVWAPVAARAADGTSTVASPLVTPRLVSAIGGGSLKPGAPAPKPSYALTDATGGGPGFPTRPLRSNAAPTSPRSAGTPVGLSVWWTTLIASMAFGLGAGLASAVARHRGGTVAVA